MDTSKVPARRFRAVDVEQRYDYRHPGHGETEVPRRRLDRDALLGLLTNEVNDRRDAAATYRRIGQDAAADELDRECTAIEPYLRAL